MPNGKLIIDEITKEMNAKGYEIINDVRKYALIDASDYGVPQKRKRVILLGLRKKSYPNTDIQDLIKKFYLSYLPKYKKEIITVKEAIGDLPPLFPRFINEKPSHNSVESNISWHFPRFHSLRDVKIFRHLAEDIYRAS